MPALAFAPAPSSSHSWHDLYLKALFETDREKISGRIKDAERALLCREHELFSTPHCLVEREAVITALQSLCVLETCLQTKRKLVA